MDCIKELYEFIILKENLKKYLITECISIEFRTEEAIVFVIRIFMNMRLK
jgi:hypothetical protein